MSTLSQAGRHEIEQRMADLIGDEVILKLHDGEPGPNLTDNVIDTRGPVTRATFDNGGKVEFVITRSALYCVSVWANGMALFLIDLNVLGQNHLNLTVGDSITAHSFPRARVTELG